MVYGYFAYCILWWCWYDDVDMYLDFWCKPIQWRENCASDEITSIAYL